MRPSHVKTLRDLLIFHRRERFLHYGLFLCIISGFILFLPKDPARIGFYLILLFGIYSLPVLLLYRKLSKISGIAENGEEKIGNFFLSDLKYLVQDIQIKMNAPMPFEVKVFEGKHAQAMTICGKIPWLRQQDVVIIYEGLLHILSREELRAVIAHEIGHHLTPHSLFPKINEYWADACACRYYDPVALANALLKIDQHEYLFHVFLQRSCDVAETLLPARKINQKFWNELLQQVRLPFRSKSDANAQAKYLVERYLRVHAISRVRRHTLRKYGFILRKRLRGNILHRKELSKWSFLHWKHFDQRIQNHYLDKYELQALYQSMRHSWKSTVSRWHFTEKQAETHPNINKRFVFIMENFLHPVRLDCHVEYSRMDLHGTLTDR